MKVLGILRLLVFTLATLGSWGGEGSLGQVSCEEQNRDFYKILGIKRSANEREIKKAFKRMSLKYHPDKNPDDESALKKFQDISAAYETLSDADKRRKYDQCGEKCVKEAEAGGGGSPFVDIFSMFGFNGGQQEQKGPSMNIKVRISLEDAYQGKEMEIKYTRNMICPHCRGSGADDPKDVKECKACNGQGVVIEQKRLGPGFVQQFQTPCKKCGGKGRVLTSKCHVCKGANTKQALDELFLFVEKGVHDGYQETFRDAGDEQLDMRAGEVIFKVQVLPHARFTRDGDNLKTQVEISLKQALLGFRVELEHLDGHKVVLERKRGQVTQPGQVERIAEEGMPKYGMPSEFGDLLITYKVQNPETLDERQRALFKQFFQG